jgi:DNA-binding transcriptional LysR family regulator
MAFEEALTDFGIALSSLRIVIELPSNEAIRAAVEAGMGAALGVGGRAKYRGWPNLFSEAHVTGAIFLCPTA